MTNAQRYINSIRNDGKRRYAKDYLAFMCDRIPFAPKSENYGIGAMAAQAVRMNINEKIDAILDWSANHENI